MHRLRCTGEPSLGLVGSKLVRLEEGGSLLALAIRFPYSSPLRRLETSSNAGGAPRPKLPRGITGASPFVSNLAIRSLRLPLSGGVDVFAACDVDD